MQDFIKTAAQKLFRILVWSVEFAEAVNYRSFQSRGQVRGWLGRFGVVPNRHLITRWQLQHAIEIVLPRAAPVVDELSNAETMNGVTGLLTKRPDQRKSFK